MTIPEFPDSTLSDGIERPPAAISAVSHSRVNHIFNHEHVPKL
jgi:hypothetical protein